MTYSTFESSQEQGQAVEVYRFTIGAQSFFYTSAEDQITISSIDYAAIAISRNNLTEGPEERNNNVEVTVPGNNEVAALFKLSIPGLRVRVEIDRFHRLDTPTPEVIRIFDGFIVSIAFTNNVKIAKLACRPAISVLARQVPRFTYQNSCNHVLYDEGCKVDDTDPAFRASNQPVASIVGSVLTITGLGGSFTDGWFNGGYVEVIGNTDFRLVLDHVGDDLTLLFPFAIDPTIVNVFAGCDHTIQTCKSKFNNVLNYGGFAFVPTKNPFATGLR